MRVLITGVAGFVGGHLVDLLRSLDVSVDIFGLDSRPGNRSRTLGIEVVQADLASGAAVESALDTIAPDRIVHLAAQSSPQRSWDDAAGTMQTNVLGLLHILEWARRRDRWPRVLVVGSSEEYGIVDPERLPVNEDTPLRPVTPYAASKIAQGFLALQYSLSPGQHVLRTRTFHHTGPRRPQDFAEGSFARQIAEIEAGMKDPVLVVGNLDAVRDFTDVRDVVRAYWLLLERGKPGEVYNVCSGRGVRLRDLLGTLIEISGVRVDVRTDPSLLRPSDVPVFVGDPTRLKRATGWQPQVPLERTLEDLLDHWRERVRTAAPRGPA